EQHIERVGFNLWRVGVIGGQRVPVGDKEKALILILHAHPVVERADKISQVQLASGAHSAEHALTLIGAGCQSFIRILSKTPITGKISRPSKPPPKYTRISNPIHPI